VQHTTRGSPESNLDSSFFLLQKRELEHDILTDSQSISLTVGLTGPPKPSICICQTQWGRCCGAGLGLHDPRPYAEIPSPNALERGMRNASLRWHALSIEERAPG
jgi:hypothetical protein